MEGYTLIGLRPVVIPSPHGEIHLEFWLARRRDGGPHVDVVPATIHQLPLEQYAWLRENRKAMHDAVRAMVEAEWRPKKPMLDQPNPNREA